MGIQGIFPTQGSNLHVLHCRQILTLCITREACSALEDVWNQGSGLGNIQHILYPEGNFYKRVSSVASFSVIIWQFQMHRFLLSSVLLKMGLGKPPFFLRWLCFLFPPVEGTGEGRRRWAGLRPAALAFPTWTRGHLALAAAAGCSLRLLSALSRNILVGGPPSFRSPFSNPWP